MSKSGILKAVGIILLTFAAFAGGFFLHGVWPAQTSDVSETSEAFSTATAAATQVATPTRIRMPTLTPTVALSETALPTTASATWYHR